MEATPAPRLFNSGEMCWKMIRVSIMEYLSRDIFYGPLFGVQVIVFPRSDSVDYYNLS